jgi:hypothetical protein
MYPVECCHHCYAYEPEGEEEYGTGYCELRKREKAGVGYCELFYKKELENNV